jgi:PPOX class probable F420-dependent enzyme
MAVRLSAALGYPGATFAAGFFLGFHFMAYELTEQIEKHLTSDELAWLTTVTPSGRPAPRLVWFLWDGTTIVIYTQPNVAKVRHITTNPHVTVHFNSAAGGGDAVVISGTATLVPEAPLPSAVPKMVEKYAARLEQMGYEQEWYDAYSLAMHVTLEKAWTIPA